MIMIIKMSPEAKEKDILRVEERVFETKNCRPQRNVGEINTVIAVLGDPNEIDKDSFQLLPGVEEIIRITDKFKLASRTFKKEDTIVDVNGIKIGGKEKAVIMAGPCAVESREQLLACARIVKDAGGKILRGGAFKPRTSPFSFRGLEEEGLKLLAEAREETGLSVVTEVMSPEKVSLVAKYADILQIGARNMQNYDLLEAVGKLNKPVLLKRSFGATVENLLTAADYLLDQNGCQVILCERGIRTFQGIRIDTNAVSEVKRRSHLPIIIDPSHSAELREDVLINARIGIVAEAAGLIIEIHPSPKDAKCDGYHSLSLHIFGKIVKELRNIEEAVNFKIKEKFVE